MNSIELEKKNKTAILIPARYGSKRLPGKPLIELNGKKLIKHVFDICKGTGLDTFVLTDDERILREFESNCLIDYQEYDNGTERCAGAINNFFQHTHYDRFINVQGDMIDVTKECIERCALGLEAANVTTVYTDMPKDKQNDPNTVKMIRAGMEALWFCRGVKGYGEWHLGVYGYRKRALEAYCSWERAEEEKIEKLEQLRWLKYNFKINCFKVEYSGTEINTPEDVKEWNLKNA
jgi:3-deoxy-D-manno-octulosonate 8-phosphate phosphatase (KDO 8-P phosphatase)